jgi:hypothetical protein
MFPKDWDNAEKKREKSWGTQWANAIVNWHRGGYNATNFPQYKMWQRLLYANGNQPKSNQRKPADPAITNDPETLPGAGQRNLEIASTILDALVGKMMKVRMKPSVTMIDNFSMDMRLDTEARIRQLMEYQKVGAEVGQLLQQYGMTPEDVPMDMEEYQLKLDMLPQLDDEIKLETAVDFVHDRNDFPVIRKEVLLDLMRDNVALLRYYTVNGERVIRRCNPMNSGTSIITTEDGRDMIFAYEFRAVPASEVRRQMMQDPEITSAQVESVVGGMGTNVASMDGYGVTLPVGGNLNIQQDSTCLVLEFEVYSKDQFYRVVKNNGQVYNQFTPAQTNDKQTVYVGQIQNVYSGFYVMDNGLLYNWGRKNDIIREPYPMLEEEYDRTNPANAYGSFITYFIKGKSIVDRMMPHIDVIQKLWNKIEDSNDAYIPQIISIDMDTLVEATVNGSKKSQQQIMDLFLRKGIAVQSLSKYGNRSNVHKNQALSVQDNTAWQGIQFMVGQLATQIQLLQQIVGITPQTTGSFGDPEQGKYVTQLSLEGTDNVLYNYYFAQQKLVENLSRVMVFDFISNGVRGFTGTRAFFIDPQVMRGRIPNIKIVVLPTEEKIAYLYQEGQKAFDAGLITMADKLRLFQMLEAGQLKQAEAYFSIKDKRARQMQAEAKQQDYQANAQLQQQTAAMNTQGKIDLQNQKDQAAVMLAQMANQNAITLEILKAILKPETKNINLQKINDTLSEINA